jgi:hypothetical protein
MPRNCPSSGRHFSVAECEKRTFVFRAIRWPRRVRINDGPAFDDVIADARVALAIDPRSTIALNMIAYAQWHYRSQKPGPLHSRKRNPWNALASLVRRAQQLATEVLARQ